MKRSQLSSLPSIKANYYTSLIKPILEYACVVWEPHTNKDISFIESVQRCAARFVFNNYSTISSVTEMLQIKLEATGTFHHHIQDHPQSN